MWVSAVVLVKLAPSLRKTKCTVPVPSRERTARSTLQELPILGQFPLSFTRISPPLWPESLFPTRET